MANDERGLGMASLLLAFISGAVVGGSLAMLTAPRSGAETRKKVRAFADNMEERAKETVDETEEKMRALMQEGKERLKEQGDLLKSAYEAGREAMLSEREKHGANGAAN